MKDLGMQVIESKRYCIPNLPVFILPYFYPDIF